MSVRLCHAQYPDTGKGWVKRSNHRTVREAIDHVHAYYDGRFGWWYQIYSGGREVYSSDHEIGGHSVLRAETQSLGAECISLWRRVIRKLKGQP